MPNETLEPTEPYNSPTEAVVYDITTGKPLEDLEPTPPPVSPNHPTLRVIADQVIRISD